MQVSILTSCSGRCTVATSAIHQNLTPRPRPHRTNNDNTTTQKHNTTRRNTRTQQQNNTTKNTTTQHNNHNNTTTHNNNHNNHNHTQQHTTTTTTAATTTTTTTTTTTHCYTLLHTATHCNYTTTTTLRGPATVSWWRGLVPVRFAPDGEARSRPGVTVAGGPPVQSDVTNIIPCLGPRSRTSRAPFHGHR